MSSVNKCIVATIILVQISLLAMSNTDTLAFWNFCDGEAGTVATTVISTLGSTSWVGTGGPSGTDGGGDLTKGVAPIFSTDTPGRQIFPSSDSSTPIAINPQSLLFTYDSETANYGGRVSIEGIAAELTQLDNFTVEYFIKLDPEWHYAALPAWTWYSKTPLALQSGGDSVKFICPANGDAKGVSLQCLGPISPNIQVVANGGTSYNDDCWHHVAATYSRDSGKLTFYVDYVGIGSVDYINSADEGDLEFVLGTGLNNKRGTERFRGKIACLRVSSASYGVTEFLRADSTPDLANYEMAAFYSFKDGAPSSEVGVVTNLVGEDIFAGRGGIAWNGNMTKGEMPLFSADRPGKYIYSSAIAGELLAVEPQSLYFYPGNSTGGGGKVEINDMATAMTRLEEYTLEFFFKTDSYTTYRSILGYRYGDKVGCKVNLFAGSVSTITYEAITNSAPGNYTAVGNSLYGSSTGGFDDGKWHHVALVYNASASSAKMYIDYNFNQPASISFAQQFTPISYPLVLGTSAFPEKAIQEAFGGNIACVRLMTRALDTSEFMIASNQPLDTSVVFGWNFEEGTQGANLTAPLGYYHTLPKGEVPYVVGNTHPTYASVSSYAVSHVFWGDQLAHTNKVCAEFWGYAKATDLGSGVRHYAGSTLRQPRSELPTQNPVNWTMEALVKLRSHNNEWNSSGNGVLLFGKCGNIEPLQSSPQLQPRYCWYLAQHRTGQLYIVWLENDGTELGATKMAFSTESYLEDKKWHHLALTYDAEQRRLCLYVDYDMVLGQTLSDPLWDGPYEYDFARGLDIYGFEGYMDEIRFSNYVRDPAEFIVSQPTSGTLLIVR